ncbi:hypothetical protein PG997_000533 [Apiospora hydei]|uniref:Uncharacterized protein n=1 Tax=Apiospora hydei TaxID=1337664 RepID=A0ABR1XAZ7_9PEZI
MAYQHQNQYLYLQYNGDGGVSPQQQQSLSPMTESSPTSYGKWESVARRLQQPPRVHAPPLQQQQQQQQQTWQQPPMGYASEGIARAHHWVANNHPNPGPPPPPSVVSPLSTTGQQRGIGGGTDFQPPSSMSYRTLPPRPEPRERRVCGIERTHFIIIMAVALLLLVSGIATGLGVGLALNNSKSSAKSSQPSTSSTEASAAAATPTRTSSTLGFPDALTPGPIDCLQDDNKVYVSAGSSPKPFDVKCGRDYKNAGSANQHGRCAGPQFCVGVDWGPYQGSWTCWMKSQLEKPNIADDWALRVAV